MFAKRVVRHPEQQSRRRIPRGCPQYLPGLFGGKQGILFEHAHAVKESGFEAGGLGIHPAIMRPTSFPESGSRSASGVCNANAVRGKNASRLPRRRHKEQLQSHD
jgi:hypothetical protein